ncbi:MAG: hypothetical protein JRJ66_05765 [Deltaproteobacteria bacterium]|nr:hypothetical protein [Deltaproteobacteria bacterium]MBW1921266.1 hypothetical protein [Deltaproteobacteria bacterium]MBW1936611.1 hypothetical protein [Deltaproteobacteria bacterium]RLB33060.1 MAG: hypothetical protein DRH11_09890 [Deltaproteobacteria bacterium]
MGHKAEEFDHILNFSATGIGSVPFENIEETCRLILKIFPKIPFWPQFVRRGPREDMNIQFCEALPFLEIHEEQRVISIPSLHLESRLVSFYEKFLAEDVGAFAISRDYAPGLYEIVSMLQKIENRKPPYLKGQSVGPFTLSASIMDRGGKSLLHNAELLDAVAKALAIRGVWQVRKLASSGCRPIVFLDEPYLSGFGSAFVPVQRDQVIKLIGEIMRYIRERTDALVGIHCCGNTDWPMIIETRPDIISLDAFSHMDYFLLYPDNILRFLEKGGVISWGIVPTALFTGKETVGGLFARLKEGLSSLYRAGIDPERLAAQSILTPSCGTGTMEKPSAERALRLVSALAGKCANQAPGVLREN